MNVLTLYRRSTTTFVSVLSLHHSVNCFSPWMAAAASRSSSFTAGGAGFSSSSTSTRRMASSFPTWSYNEPCQTMEWSPLCNATLSLESDASLLEEDADFVLIGVPTPTKEDDDEEEESKENEDEDDSKTLKLEGVAEKIDASLDNLLSNLIADSSFKAKSGTTSATVYSSAKRRYALFGVDPTNGFDMGKAIASKLNSHGKIQKLNVLLPEASNATIVRDLTTALYQSLHSDARYKSKPKPPKYETLETIRVFPESGDTAPDSAVTEGQHIAAGVLLAKDIVNAPHNVLNSVSLAETAQRISGLSCQIWGRAECEEYGMGAFLGVARGSETEPQFIVLTYTPPDPVTSTVGVVGKGLLFDTGGYNIKKQMMELMKFDCGGAAAVLGAARAIGELKPSSVKVHFLVAACENMINERAYVPSDILTASNGKTIEVMNTDAEGRLTLADALVYADKTLDCEKIVELSTLTGACMVSLGKQICGLWTANDELAAELEDVSKVTGDKAWRMPLAKEYNEQLESKFADLKNIGGSYGGAITAALFLQNFVSSKKPFAHIDIAGPVWDDKSGATGFGTKLVVEWILRQGKK